MGLFSRPKEYTSLRYHFKRVMLTGENNATIDGCAITKIEYAKIGQAPNFEISLPTEYNGMKVLGIMPRVTTTHFEFSIPDSYLFIGYNQYYPIVPHSFAPTSYIVVSATADSYGYKNFKWITNSLITPTVANYVQMRDLMTGGLNTEPRFFMRGAWRSLFLFEDLGYMDRSTVR